MGADANVISKQFALEQNLNCVQTALLQLESISGKQLSCYGAYQVDYLLTDSWGHTCKCNAIFYSCNKEGALLTLGLLLFIKEGIVINLQERSWRFAIKPKHKIVHPKKFAKKANKVTAIYALVCSAVVASKPHQNLTKSSGAILDKLKDYKDVFSNENASKLPYHKNTDHAINTGDKPPPYGPLYNLSIEELAELRQYLSNELAKGRIHHSVSPAGAPILFVPKKDSGLRLCVDYRGLNKITVKNRHPLPLISKTLNWLGQAKRFTKLDLKDAYH